MTTTEIRDTTGCTWCQVEKGTWCRVTLDTAPVEGLLHPERVEEAYAKAAGDAPEPPQEMLDRVLGNVLDGRV